MTVFRRLTAVVACYATIATLIPPMEARTRKGDQMVAQGRVREARKDWDAALDLYERALATDPADPGYQLLTNRARFQAAQKHLDTAMTLRSQGRLDEALVEFQKAYAMDPGSSAAQQEIRQTQQMIEREKEKAEKGESKPEERALTPAQLEKKREQEKIATMLPVPELKPLNQQPINIKMNNQPYRVLFETVGKLAGINVLFDPDYGTGPNSSRKQSVDISNATLDEALDYLGVLTRSFWKPLSPNAIFVTEDSVTKRRDYEEQVAKVFYLTNVNTPQEMQEIITAVRGAADLQRIFVYNSQNAIIIRGEADKVALAEKLIADLDKPRAEVVVDVIVLSTSVGTTRNLSASLVNGGLNMPLTYNPRGSIRATVPSTTTTNADGTSSTTSAPAIPLSNIGKWATSDYALTLPNGLLEALLNDHSTKILQSPQLRSVDNQKATLKIGDREPTATGSFQPGIGGVGINPLVNTQFTFIDVGVNVDLTPKVHDNGEVSMHVEIEISAVRDHVNLGGIDQPVISQEKAIHDIRLKDGQVNLLAGLNQTQETKTVVGIPFLSNIPLLKYLFSSEQIDKSQSELLIALIPHIVRRPEINQQNLRGIAVGNASSVKLNYAPPKPPEAPKPAETPKPPAGPAQPAPGAAVAPAPAQPAPGAVSPAPPQPAPPAPGTAVPPAPAQPAQQAPAAQAPQAAAPTGNAEVSFVPGQLSTLVGGNITMSLVMKNAANVFAAPLQIKFDPKVLRMTDVVNGDLIGGQQVTFTKNIHNDTGVADVNLSRAPGSGGVSGSGTVVTLRFQAVGRGVATVSVPQFAARDVQGRIEAQGSPLAIVTVR